VNSNIFYSKELVFSYQSLVEEKFRNLDENDYLQKFDLIGKSCKDPLQKLLFDLVVSHAIKAEVCAPGASIFFKRQIESRFLHQKPTSSVLRSTDIPRLFESLTKDKETSETLTSIFELCDIQTKIVVKDFESKREKTIVELQTGCCFESAIPAFSLSQKEILDPIVVVVDGIVESVSEIHHLLEEAGSLKEHIVFFARGFSDDVINTLKVNYDRGTVRCVPVVVKYDIDGFNLLNDVAVVCGSDVVSSLKGDLISSIKIKDASRVESVVFSENGTIVSDKKNSANVNSHLLRLQKKSNESVDSIVTDALSKRIQRLGMKQINIFLSEKHKRQKHLFDRCIRAFKSASEFGVCYLKDGCYPTAAVICGDFFAKKLLSSLESMGCVVV
jgi:hypothetical protein